MYILGRLALSCNFKYRFKKRKGDTDCCIITGPLKLTLWCKQIVPFIFTSVLLYTSQLPDTLCHRLLVVKRTSCSKKKRMFPHNIYSPIYEAVIFDKCFQKKLQKDTFQKLFPYKAPFILSKTLFLRLIVNPASSPDTQVIGHAQRSHYGHQQDGCYQDDFPHSWFFSFIWI